jgi:hypothetical protein
MFAPFGNYLEYGAAGGHCRKARRYGSGHIALFH